MEPISKLRERLEQAKNDINSILLEIATTVSITAKALAERTIKDKGFGASYSKKEVPAFWFYGKEINNSGKTFLESLTSKGKKEKKKIEDITEADLIDGVTTWGDFRVAQGLQKKFVDLTYSGKMWAGMFPKEAYQSGSKFISPLGHNNKDGQNQMDWNYERYGDFIGKVLSGDNFDVMGEVAVEEFMRIIVERYKI